MGVGIVSAFFAYIFSRISPDKLSTQNELPTKRESISNRINPASKNNFDDLNEDEFIAFVKAHYRDFDKHFIVEVIRSGKMEIKHWSSKNYIIISEIDPFSFKDFITVKRRSDNKIIFSGSWTLPENHFPTKS